MNELIAKLLANNLKDLAGLEISGTIPIPESMLNEALAEALKSAASPAPTGAAGNTSGAASAAPAKPALPAVDIRPLLAHIQQAEISARDGRLTIRFDVRVGQ